MGSCSCRSLMTSAHCGKGLIPSAATLRGLFSAGSAVDVYKRQILHCRGSRRSGSRRSRIGILRRFRFRVCGDHRVGHFPQSAVNAVSYTHLCGRSLLRRPQLRFQPQKASVPSPASLPLSLIHILFHHGCKCDRSHDKDGRDIEFADGKCRNTNPGSCCDI